MLLNKKRKLAAGILLSLAAASILTGCQEKTTNASSSPSAAAVGTPSPSAASPAKSPEKNGSVQAISFAADEIIISPDQTEILQITGINDKQEATAIADAQAVTFVSSDPDVIAVDAGGGVKAGPKGRTGASAVITADYEGKTASVAVKLKYALEDTVKTVAGKNIVTNETDMAVMVNKKRGLPDDYEPSDLTEPQVEFSFSGKSEKKLLRKEAAQALEQLFQLAAEDGIKLYGVSGYRSKATQTTIYNYNVKTQGQEEADKVSAKPGFSEHQTGLAIDVSSRSANFALEEVFGSTEEGKWLAEHAHEAGFIIRYLKGKEHITGYSYEPWHIRYVGVDMAKEIYDNGWTLEEYFQEAVPVNN